MKEKISKLLKDLKDSLAILKMKFDKWRFNKTVSGTYKAACSVQLELSWNLRPEIYSYKTIILNALFTNFHSSHNHLIISTENQWTDANAKSDSKAKIRVDQN